MEVCLLLLVSLAFAGDGPWAMGPGVTNVYGGFDYYRYSRLNNGGGTAEGVRAPISAGAVSSVITLGLRRHLEGELKAGIEWARVTDPDDPNTACVKDPRPKPDDWCATSFGLGDIYGALKYQFLDEFSKAPLSASLGLKIRSGEGNAHFRHRLTNLGDGTTDVGAQLSLGKDTLIGASSFRVQAVGGYFYRFANDFEDKPGGGVGKYPKDEVWGMVQATIGLTPSFDIGPEVVGFHRLGGLDVPELDLEDPNHWNKLDAAQIKVGLKVNIYSLSNRTVSLGASYAVYARNNPTDTLVISAGVGQLFDASKD